MSILRFFAGITESLNKAQAVGFLLHILSPVYRILDEGGDLGQVEEKQVGTSNFHEYIPTQQANTYLKMICEPSRRRFATLFKKRPALQPSHENGRSCDRLHRPRDWNVARDGSSWL